jgi:hypothetical protein
MEYKKQKTCFDIASDEPFHRYKNIFLHFILNFLIPYIIKNHLFSVAYKAEAKKNDRNK